MTAAAIEEADVVTSTDEDADKRRTVGLFESFGPRVVTRRQYEDIAAAQREKKLEFEYSLGSVVEERFHAIAPLEAKKEIDESGADIESVADFVAAVPEAYGDLCKQAVELDVPGGGSVLAGPQQNVSGHQGPWWAALAWT
jgi:hypothetical protein